MDFRDFALFAAFMNVETASLSHKNQSDFNACFKKSIKLQENERHLYQLFTNQLNTGLIKYFCRWKKPYLNDWILRFQKAILVWFQITPIISDLTIHMRKFQHAQDLLVMIYPKLHSKSCDYLYTLTAWYPLYCLKRHIFTIFIVQTVKHDGQKRN